MNLDESMLEPQNDPTVEEFVARLETIPWFANLGKPLPEGSPYRRIKDWDHWAGPEDREEFDAWFMQFREELLATGDRAALEELWNRIHSIVMRCAARNVPFDPEQDAWHGPTTAVWQAAWIAGLVGLCLATKRPLPPELRELWRWYVAGHWPCDWMGYFPRGRPIIF